MKAFSPIRVVVLVALASNAVVLCAQTATNASPGSSASGPTSDSTMMAAPAQLPGNSLATKGNPASFQGQEVVQMTQNGVDVSVVRAYIEGSPAIQPPNAEEIIYLHEKGVPADLIAAMIRRGAQLQEQKSAAAGSTPAVPAPQPTAGMVEPAPSYAYSPPVTPSYAYTSPSYIYTTYPSYGYVYSSPYYCWWDNWDYPGYRYPSVWGGSRAWRYGYRPYNRFYSGFHSYPSYTHANSFRYFNRPGGSFSGNRFSGHFGGQRFVNSRPHSMVGPPRSAGFPIGGRRR